jgi:hypothetical protein
MEELAAPLRLTAYRDLRRFYQQKTKQRVALLADVSGPSPVTAGFFRWNQTHIAGDLFPAVKTVWRANHQLEGQRRQYPDSGMRPWPVRLPRQLVKNRDSTNYAPEGQLVLTPAYNS